MLPDVLAVLPTDWSPTSLHVGHYGPTTTPEPGVAGMSWPVVATAVGGLAVAIVLVATWYVLGDR